MQDIRRRYWAGGYHFHRGSDNQLDRFFEESIWEIGYSDTDKVVSIPHKLLTSIKIGDFVALKSYGGRHRLKISGLGIVIDITQVAKGRVGMIWISRKPTFRGEAPRGTGAGNWQNTLLEIRREEDIVDIFGPVLSGKFGYEPRPGNAFDFWNDPAEDIYEDYAKTNEANPSKQGISY